jgi:hypothetical protein
VRGRNRAGARTRSRRPPMPSAARRPRCAPRRRTPAKRRRSHRRERPRDRGGHDARRARPSPLLRRER